MTGKWQMQKRDSSSDIIAIVTGMQIKVDIIFTNVITLQTTSTEIKAKTDGLSSNQAGNTIVNTRVSQTSVDALNAELEMSVQQ